MTLFNLAGGCEYLAMFHPLAGMLLRAAIGHMNSACPEPLFNERGLIDSSERDPSRGDARLNISTVRFSQVNSQLPPVSVVHPFSGI